MKIGIVLGSIRSERLGASVAEWALDVASKHSEADFEIIDIANFDIPLFTDPVIPAMRQGTYPDPHVQALSDALAQCDGYIFVTAEYNHGIPGGFKNAIDHIGPELNTKPVAFVSYGADRGSRAVEQWRQVVANFNMFDIRAQVSFDLFTEFTEGACTPNERKADELDALIGSLVPIAAKLKA